MLRTLFASFPGPDTNVGNEGGSRVCTRKKDKQQIYCTCRRKKKGDLINPGKDEREATFAHFSRPVGNETLPLWQN